MTLINNAITLPSLRVDVVEQNGVAHPEWTRCELGEHLRFSLETLNSYCFAPWEPVIFDALVLAAAVEFCASRLKRPSLGWGRDISLRLPVHDPDRWSSQKIMSELVGTLAFLTGDRWSIQFVPRKQRAEEPCQNQFRFPTGASAIIPFSDGLDSRSVAALERRRIGDGLLRVRVGSKAADSSNASGQKQPFTAIPYRVLAKKGELTESSARSRGFKFALISGIAAYLANVGTVIFPESGQGTLGPVLVTVGQAYGDYRNHPLFTERMERFLTALLERHVCYQFPRLWHTKGETLEAYISQENDKLSWIETRSCWQNSRQVSIDGKRRQCGICAACMLRRMSVHAAGLEESQGRYLWESLAASTFEGGAAPQYKKSTASLREYAIAGVLHLDHLAGLARSKVHQPVIKRNAFQLSRSLGLPLMEVETRLNRLLKKHAEEWKAFVDSVGPDSFITQWCARSDEHAA